jgi:hypothetical protein
MRAASYRLCRLADVLRRVLVPALAVSLSMASSPAASAAASAPGGRVVLITVDGTSIADWTRAGVFGSMGSAGLLATRTATETKDPVLLRAAAYTTLGAGAPAELESTAARIDAGSGVLAGAVGEALKRRGLSATSIGDASGDDVRDGPGSRAVMHADGGIAFPPDSIAPADAPVTSVAEPGVPTGRRTDYPAMAAALQRALAWANVVVVDLGDAARADRTYWERPASRRPWIDRALREADRFARAVDGALDPSDTVIVASLVPPLARARIGARLAAVAMTGPRGTLTSGTTRREAVITLTDLAPTILDRVGVAFPDEMQGRVVHIEPSSAPLLEAEAFDAEFARARSARWPLTRIWLFTAAALASAAFLTIVAGRGRSPGNERFPRRFRDFLATGLIATAAAPAAVLIAPQLPGSSIEVLGLWTVALAVASAIAVRIAFRTHFGLVAVAMIDAAVVVGDLLAGTPLASRSPLGFLVAGGGRFYGIDEGLLGVALAGSAIAIAGWLDGRWRPRSLAIAALPLAFVALVTAAPSLGSKFGAGFTLVPAFGVLLVLAFGYRIDRVTVIAITIGTVLLVGGLAAADALAAPEIRSHIGREIAGQTPASALVVRKVTSFFKITATTIWLPVSIVIAVPMALLVRRRANLLARSFWGLPSLRSALIAVAVGCGAAMGANDTGIIVVAPALVLTAAALYEPLLAPRTGRPGRP